MNNIRSLEHPTMTGLKSLSLDDLTTDTMTCENMNANKMTGDYFSIDKIEATNVTVDNELELSDTGFIIIGKGTLTEKIVTDTEIGYLDGVTSGIQTQLNSIDNDTTDLQDQITINTDDISANLINQNAINYTQLVKNNDLWLGNLINSEKITELELFETQQYTKNITLTNSINTNTGKITTNTNNINTNAGNITTNTNSINTNAGNITTNTNSINTNAGNITTNTNSINTNASAITTIKQKTDPMTMSSTALSMARRISFTDNGSSQLGYIGAIGADLYYVSNAHLNFQSTGDINIKSTTTYFGFSTTAGSITLKNNGTLTLKNEVQTNAYTDIDHTNVNYIPNMKTMTDSFETVTAGELYTRKKIYFRDFTTGANRGYIGLVGSTIYVGNTNNPIIFNPGSSFVSQYCEYSYFGSNLGPGRIKLNSLSGAGGSIIIKDESQNNAYTDADHTAVGQIPTIIEDVDILLGRTTANETAINQLQSSYVPCGTVLITARPPTLAPPTGYLYCDGALIPKSIYSELWDMIGDTYRYTKPISPTFFYLPDLRQLYVRGSQNNTTYPVQALPSAGMGAYQGQSVMTHSHDYERPHITSDCGNYAPAPRTVWDDTTTPTKTTTLYDKDNVQIYPSTAETRPESMTMNYMIKT